MPSLPANPTPLQLRRAYEQGLPGWRWETRDQRDWGDFLDEGHAQHMAFPGAIRGTGKGKRATIWRSRERFDPGAFGKEPQGGPDCTSHGSRNARDDSRCVEIDIKGEPERYHKRGATEPTYGARGHGGAGMDPARAARFERDFGFLVRQDYPGVVDLTRYDVSIGSRWGSRGVPEAVEELCREHNVGSYSVPQTTEEARDLLFNGYAGHSGQSWAGSANRDGVFITGGRPWNHDMATCGMDDTQEHYPAKYGCLFLVMNSWGAWTSKPAKWNDEVYGPWPVGSFWVPEDIYARYFVGSGSIMFYSNIKGFPAQDIPDYGTPEGVLG